MEFSETLGTSQEGDWEASWGLWAAAVKCKPLQTISCLHTPSHIDSMKFLYRPVLQGLSNKLAIQRHYKSSFLLPIESTCTPTPTPSTISSLCSPGQKVDLLTLDSYSLTSWGGMNGPVLLSPINLARIGVGVPGRKTGILALKEATAE